MVVKGNIFNEESAIGKSGLITGGGTFNGAIIEALYRTVQVLSRT